MSITLQKKFGKKVPWVLGKSIRAPRVKYPVYREGNLALPSPGRSMMMIIIFIVLFWLVMGGIYISIKDPIAVGANSAGEAVWLYPSINDAFVIESIVAAMVIFIGGAGFFLLYTATKHSFNYSYAVKLLVIGGLMTVGAFVLLQYMLAVKSNKI